MKIKVFILTILITPIFVFANGGSLYSRLGIGDINQTFSARRLALGELGTSVADVENISSLNPASWFRLGVTRIETGFNYKGTNIKNNISSSFYSDAKFSGVTFGFPLQRDYGITLVMGLFPVSTVSYEVQEKNRFASLEENLTTYKGDGGISKIMIGSSYKLPFGLALGAAFEYYTGDINYSSKLEFTSDNSSLANAEFVRDYTYKGVGSSIGIISNDFSDIFGIESIKDLRLGLNFNYVSKLNTDSTLTSKSIVGSNDLLEGNFDTNIPSKFSAGLSFYYDARYQIMIDYLYQPWSKFESNGNSIAEFRDLQKVSLGIEFRNPQGLFGGTFWEKVIYRGGISFEETQFEINNQGVNQFIISAGIGLPMGVGNFLDFALQYGVRGKTGNGLFDEKFYKAAFSINFGELWFQRREW